MVPVCGVSGCEYVAIDNCRSCERALCAQHRPARRERRCRECTDTHWSNLEHKNQKTMTNSALLFSVGGAVLGGYLAVHWQGSIIDLAVYAVIGLIAGAIVGVILGFLGTASS